MPTTIHASVLPKCESKCCFANASDGWKCTGSRWPASSSLTSSPVDVPSTSTCLAPSHAGASASTASRSQAPFGSRVRPLVSWPNMVLTEATQSSGPNFLSGEAPRNAAMASPPR